MQHKKGKLPRKQGCPDNAVDIPIQEFLVPIERDLVLAQRLCGGEPAAALAAFTEAWREELGARLRSEVRLLAPIGTPGMAARMILRFESIRDFAEGDRKEDRSRAGIRELGMRLSDYLLWKRHEFLPMLEVVATPSDLLRMQRLQSAKSVRSA